MPFSATLQLQAFAEEKCAPVSIHARVWRATQSVQRADQLHEFQSTPACGGRRGGSSSSSLVSHVSIHARVWRATVWENVPGVLSSFQSTPACGGRRGQHKENQMHYKFQSTPACGGRLSFNTTTGQITGFNPRPRVAGDLQALGDGIHVLLFQSTPACGGRHSKNGSMYETYFVSIHARVWRATGRGAGLPRGTPSFNPRPRVAGDKRHTDS